MSGDTNPSATQSDAFLGEWELVPELSLYENGEPPRSGTYRLSLDGDAIAASIDWVDAQGASETVAFGGPLDGSEVVLDTQGPAVLALERLDAATLDSVVRVAGQQVAWARRRASDDGQLLAVVQTGATPEGEPFRNFQVYRRREGAGK